MVNGSLTDYVRAQLQRGYPPESIRSVLIQSGYNPQDVDFALRIAAAQPTRRFELSGRNLVIAVGALLAIVLLVFAGFLVFRSAPKDIQLTLRVQPDQVLPGDTVTLSTVLTSAQSRAVPVSLEYVVSEQFTHQPVTSRAERLDVGASAVSSQSITLPASLASGSYEVRLTARFEGLTRVQTDTLTVLPPSAPAPGEMPAENIAPAAPIEQEHETVECPASCDDLNPGTEDSCVRGSCVHTKKENSCGNGDCESGENRLLCPEDCGGAQDKSAVQQQAIQLARNDPEKAATMCNSLTIPVDMDPCFAAIANASKKSALCANIQESSIKDDCLMEFAFAGDYSVCPQLSNRYLLTSCQSLARFSTVQQEQQAAEAEAQQIIQQRIAEENETG